MYIIHDSWFIYCTNKDRLKIKSVFTECILRLHIYYYIQCILDKQGQKRPLLDMSKKMIERREREGEREK